MRRYLGFLGLALGVAFVAGTHGQQPPAKDPQSSIEPRSGPGVGQKYLQRMVGEWDVQKSFFPRSGEPAKSTGHCRQTMIHDGRFLQSEFTFDQRGGGQSKGLGMIGFEPATGKFTSVWTDSRRTAMSFRHSRDKFNGEEIVLVSASLDPAEETRRSRTVSRLEDQDRKLIHRQYAINQDGSERLVMELVMTRVKAR